MLTTVLPEPLPQVTAYSDGSGFFICNIQKSEKCFFLDLFYQGIFIPRIRVFKGKIFPPQVNYGSKYYSQVKAQQYWLRLLYDLVSKLDAEKGFEFRLLNFNDAMTAWELLESDIKGD